ncbi:hypothetical protein MJO29_015396 [Puccinia striiformis f. sp. tritici]|nr:hypothetical protein MJO29_015396 [Puccinia striiformis f. sp. tritici]
MSQQTHPSPYQRPAFHPRPVPFPPPYQRVANHSYGLRPRVAPIRGYGPVPRPSPVHPTTNVPARRSGFVQRPLTPMPVTRNGPVLSNPVRKAFRPESHGFSAGDPQRPFPIGYGIKLFSIWRRPGPVLTANIRDPRLLMGNQTALRTNSANPYLFPPPSPVFDRTLRSPTPFPPSSVWAEFFRNTASSQGSSSGHRRMDLDIPLVDRIGPPASTPRPRHMSTPPSSPRGPPGYVPSPSAANWGRRRGSESSTVGQPLSRRSSTSAASLPESEEVVVYHPLSVDQIHMLLEQPEGINPYDRHLFSNRVPKDKYRFTAVGFAKLCHAFPTTSQAERDARVAFFESDSAVSDSRWSNSSEIAEETIGVGGVCRSKRGESLEAVEIGCCQDIRQGGEPGRQQASFTLEPDRVLKLEHSGAGSDKARTQARKAERNSATARAQDNGATSHCGLRVDNPKIQKMKQHLSRDGLSGDRQ